VKISFQPQTLSPVELAEDNHAGASWPLLQRPSEPEHGDQPKEPSVCLPASARLTFPISFAASLKSLMTQSARNPIWHTVHGLVVLFHQGVSFGGSDNFIKQRDRADDLVRPDRGPLDRHRVSAAGFLDRALCHFGRHSPGKSSPTRERMVWPAISLFSCKKILVFGVYCKIMRCNQSKTMKNGFSHIKMRARDFVYSKSGTISIVFTFGILSIASACGLALDYSKGLDAKASLNSAADAAALAGARTIGSNADRRKQAKLIFDQNIALNSSIKNINFTSENITRNNNNIGYKVTVTGTYETTFSKIFGRNNLEIASLAEAIVSITSFTEVAMVLDTTASMEGWKLEALKENAKRFVDELRPLALNPEHLKIGVVPFAQYVNIGKSNRKQPWLEVPDDWKETWTTCEQTFPDSKFGPPCQKVWVQGRGRRGFFEEQCTLIPGKPVEVCTKQEKWHRWHGCVGSRPYPLNTRDSNYSTKIPGLIDNEKCFEPILELTTSGDAVKRKVDAFISKGTTYIPAGLIWGWRMLTPQAPLNARRNTLESPTNKFLVLMTDGVSIRSLTAPDHEGEDKDMTARHFQEICNNIANDKENKIMILSMAVDLNKRETKDIMKNCAFNTGGHFYDVRDKSQFDVAFENIATIIATPRLSR
jgi:Flp pilus assembly protein TadG